MSLIEESLDRGATVITCEKGAGANNPIKFKNAAEEGKLGYNAAVGGGARPMETSKSFQLEPKNIKAVHMKLGATLEFTRQLMVHGMPGRVAMRLATQQGMAEAESKDITSLTRTEILDSAMKTVIYINNSGLLEEKDFITLDDLNLQINDEQIKYAHNKPAKNHFIVSMYPTNRETDPQPEVIGGFDITRGNWRIVGGYQDPKGIEAMAPLTRLAEGYIGVVTSLGTPDRPQGDYPVIGPGAKPGPTASAALYDCSRLLRANNKFSH